MTCKTIDGLSLCEAVTQNYRNSLIPKGKKNAKWTGETFSTYVHLLYPHITVVSGQEWLGVMTKYKLLCDIHGTYEAPAYQLIDEKIGCNCKGCSSDKNKASAGTRRSPRATKEEKELAAQLRAEGLSYRKIGLELNKSQTTIQRWLNPEYSEKGRQANRRWASNNREQQRANCRRYKDFDHGRATLGMIRHKRRGIEYHCIDTVFLPDHPDADYQGFVSFNIWELIKGDADAMSMMSFEGTEEDVSKRKKQQIGLEKISGEKYSLEHLIPLSRGGIHCPENFANRALDLNRKKHNNRIKEDEELFCKRLFNIK